VGAGDYAAYAIAKGRVATFTYSLAEVLNDRVWSARSPPAP
jgi:hypothetical protein